MLVNFQCTVRFRTLIPIYRFRVSGRIENALVGYHTKRYAPYEIMKYAHCEPDVEALEECFTLLARNQACAKNCSFLLWWLEEE